MEAPNNQGNALLSSAASASGDALAEPLKLQLEVTLPPALGGELKAWRKAFERIADVMERWLESSLAHPSLPPPPVMPWALAPLQQPEQPSVPLVAPEVVAPTPAPETLPLALPTPAPALLSPSKPILPEEMPLLLVGDSPTLPRTEQTEKTALVKTLDIRPDPPEETERGEVVVDREQAAEYALRGDRNRTAGHKEKALECYREALAHDADCMQAYLGRAGIYIEQERFNEALLDCNSALQREPERAVLYVLRGLIYSRLGNLKRALDEADDAIRFDAQLPSAYMLRGSVRFKRGMVGEALEDVKQAIRLRPKDAKFHCEFGRLLALTGKYEQAARVYAKALELAPNFHEARLQRGIALREAGDAADAEAELTEYLRRCPRNPVAHYQRGLCRLAQRNYAQATTDFDKVLAADPNDEAAVRAKQKALDLWEGTARQTSGGNVGATASTVALAATATDTPPAMPSRPYVPPTSAKPTPPKFRPAKPERKPARARRNDDEPARWVRPAKWVCTLFLVGVLGFGGFRLLANFMHNPYKPDNVPPASAKLTADELLQQYKSNPASAQAELSEHYIEVHGPIGRHAEDKSPPVIELAVSRTNTTIACTLKANPNLHQQMMLSRIEGECQATIVGKCAGLQGNRIVLNECQIIKVAKGAGVRRR